MESLQSLKSRTKAVRNVGQITKAMEVVSATKMRRAQEVALNSRPYAFKALDLLGKISENTPIQNPLLEKRDIKKTLLMIVASDKGLAGSFNAQITKVAENFLKIKDIKNCAVITIGKKANAYSLRKKLEIVENISGAGDYATPSEIENIATTIIRGYENKDWDEVIAISTHFRTALKQEVLTRQILPVDIGKIKETVAEIIPETGRFSELRSELVENNTASNDYLLEPSPEITISQLIPHLIKMQIYHLVLEANASEHSARRVAMKTASDNAEELVDELTIAYNKARQAGITKELSEITSTQTALN
ncbi:MAG: ATP synthase F1 subunit gamma [Candidatus Paceibacterota bacterium]|jgi:F-type H+-transporting ATPase subunit gamma